MKILTRKEQDQLVDNLAEIYFIGMEALGTKLESKELDAAVVRRAKALTRYIVRTTGRIAGKRGMDRLDSIVTITVGKELKEKESESPEKVETEK